MGGGLLKSWSKRQRSVAMSSGEAGYYAVVKAAADAIGVQALAAHLGWEVKVDLFVDSSAAKAIASRLGLGKIRHLEVRYRWLQEVIAEGRLAVRKVAGRSNPADLLTKAIAWLHVVDLLFAVNAHFVHTP